jgi:hypothetical protein
MEMPESQVPQKYSLSLYRAPFYMFLNIHYNISWPREEIQFLRLKIDTQRAIISLKKVQIECSLSGVLVYVVVVSGRGQPTPFSLLHIRQQSREKAIDFSFFLLSFSFFFVVEICSFFVLFPKATIRHDKLPGLCDIFQVKGD